MVVGHMDNAGFASSCFGFISTSGILGFLVFIPLVILSSELIVILNKSLWGGAMHAVGKKLLRQHIWTGFMSITHVPCEAITHVT